MNCNKNPINRQNSLKLKERWINAFRNELLLNENIQNEEGVILDPKEIDVQPAEDFFNCCTKGEVDSKDEGRPRNAEDLKEPEEEQVDKEEEEQVDEEQVEDEEGGDNIDKEDKEEEEGCNEFRDRVPSATELQMQLEELMKALISLQVSRFINW